MAKRAAPAKGDDKARSKDGAKEAYVVFARRFRPNRFADVAGQTATISALRQALKSGRLAQAYLFCGPRGVGKTSLARIVARRSIVSKARAPAASRTIPATNAMPARRSRKAVHSM